jgi:hypothetical protein
VNDPQKRIFALEKNRKEKERAVKLPSVLEVHLPGPDRG